MRRTSAWITLAALPLALAAPLAQAQEPAADLSGEAQAIDWLLKVSEAARHASYEGVVVYRDGQRMETMRIVHRHQDGREQERLTSLNGAPRDIFREDDHVTCIHSQGRVHQPDGPLPRAQRVFPEMSRATLETVAPHYEFIDLGRARVAGQACRGVAVKPRDAFRYGYVVWADEKTFVPLKVSLTGHRGQVVEEMMFTRVDFPSVIPDEALGIPARRLAAAAPPPSTTATDAAGEADGPVPVAPATAEAPRWLPRRLPPGFRVTLRTVKPGPDGRGLVEHVLLSDGLSAVSVFGSPMRPTRPYSGLSSMGGVNAYGRVLGSMHFTVVGEVPPTTVRYIGDALEPADPAAAAGPAATR